jgi:hypothetical protein
MMRRRREKVFGPGRAVPLDRNAKARIAAYARAWDRLHRCPGQRGGALGRAALDVLGALLWAFHNARSGCCYRADGHAISSTGTPARLAWKTMLRVPLPR